MASIGHEVSARYRQSLLGFGWVAGSVLVGVLTFSFLNRAQILPIATTPLPYPLFVLFNMSFWQLFASGLQGMTGSLVNAGSLINKINFPRETLVLAAYAQALIDFMLRLLMVAIGFAIFGVTPHPAALLLPLVLLPLAALTVGLGLLLSLAHAIVRDTAQVVAFLLSFGMFLTPVVYPKPSSWGRWAVLNPITPFLVAAQDLVTIGHLSDPTGFALSATLATFCLLAGWRIFHLTVPRIAERV